MIDHQQVLDDILREEAGKCPICRWKKPCKCRGSGKDDGDEDDDMGDEDTQGQNSAQSKSPAPQMHPAHVDDSVADDSIASRMELRPHLNSSPKFICEIVRHGITIELKFTRQPKTNLTEKEFRELQKTLELIAEKFVDFLKRHGLDPILSNYKAEEPGYNSIKLQCPSPELGEKFVNELVADKTIHLPGLQPIKTPVPAITEQTVANQIVATPAGAPSKLFKTPELTCDPYSNIG